jgi:hypothetical protein
MVGVASASVFIDFFTAFAGIGAITSPSVVLQLADGSIDVIGFSGGISPAGPLTMSASFLLPGTAGSPALFALDQDFGGISVDANAGAIVNGIILNTVEMVGVTLSGRSTTCSSTRATTTWRTAAMSSARYWKISRFRLAGRSSMPASSPTPISFR